MAKPTVKPTTTKPALKISKSQALLGGLAGAYIKILMPEAGDQYVNPTPDGSGNYNIYFLVKKIDVAVIYVGVTIFQYDVANGGWAAIGHEVKYGMSDEATAQGLFPGLISIGTNIPTGDPGSDNFKFSAIPYGPGIDDALDVATEVTFRVWITGTFRRAQLVASKFGMIQCG